MTLFRGMPSLNAFTAAAAIPAPALGAGYLTRTFGPALTLGSNWYGFNFFSNAQPGGSAVQNPDGTVYLNGTSSNTYNAGISTAQQDNTKPQKWAGLAFGGGAYFEGVFSFTGAVDGSVIGWPSFWLLDVEHLSGVLSAQQWPSQAAGYGHWCEFDIIEFDLGVHNKYGIAAHDHYGVTGSLGHLNSSLPAYAIGSANFAAYQTYGLLWVPATATTQGYANWYFNSALIGSVSWNQYSALNAPPPVAGSSAFSVADVRHLCPIFGTSNQTLPMTLSTCSVWQASAGQNVQF